jgi:transposase InsO family protein
MTRSTADHARLSAGAHPPKHSTSIYILPNANRCDDRLNPPNTSSWAFSDPIKTAGLALSMGRIGDDYDNGMMESFWARMQTELLNPKKWRTRLELANAIFEYLEVFHNRKRRHSSLGMLTPTEYETLHHDQQIAA